MNRSDLKKLAEMRLSDAKALLRTKRNNAGAYYIAGYAVECAIKACIAKKQKLYEFPPKPEDVRKLYTHDVKALLVAAELKTQLDADCQANIVLKQNWSLVTAWNESVRYDRGIDRSEAVALISAIEDPQDGVLTWFKQYW